MRNYKKVNYDFYCKECKKPYTAKNIRSEYCSSSCRVSAYRRKDWQIQVDKIKTIYKMKFNNG